MYKKNILIFTLFLLFACSNSPEVNHLKNLTKQSVSYVNNKYYGDNSSYEYRYKIFSIDEEKMTACILLSFEKGENDSLLNTLGNIFKGTIGGLEAFDYIEEYIENHSDWNVFVTSNKKNCIKFNKSRRIYSTNSKSRTNSYNLNNDKNSNKNNLYEESKYPNEENENTMPSLNDQEYQKLIKKYQDQSISLKKQKNKRYEKKDNSIKKCVDKDGNKYYSNKSCN